MQERFPAMRLQMVQSVIAFAAVCSMQSVLIGAFQTRYRFDSHAIVPERREQDLFLFRRRDLVRTNSQPRRAGDSSDASAFRFHTRNRNQQQRDVVIVGGALAGLSTALYLSQMDPSRHITILDREAYGNHRFSSSNSNNAQPASFAAAGMLAPQSERLPPGHLLDLCMASRRLFPDFCDMVETLARESGDEGAPFLYESEFPDQKNSKEDDDNYGNLDPWSVGYVGTGGFLAPAFAGDSVATWAPPEEVGSAVWLDATQARELEPLLHPDVVGGWWFPEDASVDARRLTCSLRAACIAAGVQFLSGQQYEVVSLDLVDGTCRGLWLKNSKSKQGQRYIRAKTVLMANGAWMRSLLPVPIEPHKGQSLSLRMPKDRPPILRRVLFAQDSYIVPKADGRIVVGATVEAGSYDPNVTPAGLMHIMAHAVQLVPALKDLPVEETWVGLRPTTPDKGPILGKTPWDNLFVAGGYWRNGVLLAPKTGQLLASLILSCSSSSSSSSDDESQFATLEAQDKVFLDAFAWDRFTSADKGVALAANARYAASMHPIHKRSSTGVSAAVGTELGSYSSARAAVDDRKRDRDALNDEGAFERAAAMGKQDGSAYSFGEKGSSVPSKSGRADWPSLLQKSSDDSTATSSTASATETTEEFAAPAMANDATSNDLAATYEAIRKNKERNAAKLVESSMGEQDDDRPDPGFRIYHVDAETGQERVVPPYTQPGDFLKMIETEKKGTQPVVNGESTSLEKESPVVAVEAPVTTPEAVGTSSDNGGDDDYNETTYDGYTVIQQSNSRASRQEELEAMREARRRNRLGQDTVDEKKIGVQRMNGDSMASFQEGCE